MLGYEPIEKKLIGHYFYYSNYKKKLPEADSIEIFDIKLAETKFYLNSYEKNSMKVEINSIQGEKFYDLSDYPNYIDDLMVLQLFDTKTEIKGITMFTNNDYSRFEFSDTNEGFIFHKDLKPEIIIKTQFDKENKANEKENKISSEKDFSNGSRNSITVQNIFELKEFLKIGTPDKIEKLVLSDFEINGVAVDLINANFENLSVEFEGCEISDFSKLKNLNVVRCYYFSGCHFDEIDDNFIEMMKNEKVYSISIESEDYTNKIDFLERIKELKNISYLSLNWMGFEKIPEFIFEMNQLIWLDLNDNFISEIPKEISFLKNLFLLSLTNNRLETLPKEIGMLTSLTELNVEANNLQTIPKEIGLLTSLTELNVGENNLQTIPKELTKLRLEDLRLNSNNLSDTQKEYFKDWFDSIDDFWDF